MAKQERLALFFEKESTALMHLTQGYQGFAGLLLYQHTQPNLLKNQVKHCFFASNQNTEKIDCTIDYAQQPFANEYFDMIILYHIFDEIDQIQEILLEAKRILRHDGILLISGFEKNRICARALQQEFSQKKHLNTKYCSILEIQSALNELQFKLEASHFDFCKNSTIEKYLKHIVPFLGTGFWIKAQKELLPLTPLNVESWQLESLLTPVAARPEYSTPQKQVAHKTYE
jgi:SAM-dependent methyltransferase